MGNRKLFFQCDIYVNIAVPPSILIYHVLNWHTKASLMAQVVKNLPAMQETYVQSLGQEDPLEKEMATHSSILAWRILWTREPGRL